MRTLQIAITVYLMGLLVFYTYAVFETRAWDSIYFGWAKLFDCSFLMWLVIYKLVGKPYKGAIKWLLAFSAIRFLADVQTFITGVGVNNEWWVAAMFLLLILTVVIGMFFEFKRANKLSLP